MSLCIYCDELGPFSDEHVFPAGLGGDDSSFLLKGLVCKTCNEITFSAMEAEFMRSSAVAIARMFFQRTGRGRGSKSKAPTFQGEVEIPDSASDNLLDGELKAQYQFVVLAQLIFGAGGKTFFYAVDDAGAGHFLADLRRLMRSDLLHVFWKDAHDPGNPCVYECYKWFADTYALDSASRGKKFSGTTKSGIWIDRRRDADSPSEQHEWRPRLLQRPNGQCVLRISSSVTNIVPLLNFAREAIESTPLISLASAVSIDRPIVRVGMQMGIGVDQRVIAKIGLNLAIHGFGEQYLRNPTFKGVKDYVLTGQPDHFVELPLRMADEIARGGGLPNNRHGLFLRWADCPGRGGVLAFVIKLYGGAPRCVLLGMDIPRPAGDTNLVALVDWANHSIAYKSTRDGVWL